MRPSDLPSAQQLASNKPHGHKMRYMAGCRCSKCRAGNALYEAKMQKDRELYGPNDLVPVDRARAFMQDMRKLGIGFKTIADRQDVARTVCGEVIWPGKSGRRYIRRRTEKKILAYRPTLDTLPQIVIVPAAETVAKIQQLIRWGIPKALINQHGLLGKTPALQIHATKWHTPTCMVRTARRIRDYFARVEDIRDAWHAWRGSIPRRHYVYWKQGRSTSSSRLKDLELRRFAVTYDYIYRYPQALKDAMRAKRQIRLHMKGQNNAGKKQDVRSA
jgi:hypothetical protein